MEGGEQTRERAERQLLDAVERLLREGQSVWEPHQHDSGWDAFAGALTAGYMARQFYLHTHPEHSGSRITGASSSDCRYVICEQPRLGICQVIDTHNDDEVAFAGLAEDCEEWINDPSSRDGGKPDHWRGRGLRG